MSIEEQPFLSESKSSEVSQESLLEKVNYQERKWTSKLRLENFNYVFSLNSVAVVNGIAIIASIYFYYATWKKGLAINRYCPEIPYSPATSSLQWEQQAYDYHGHNPFGGELGTAKLNRAWEELKIHEVIRVTKEDLERTHSYHANSLMLKNGGYMGIMRVFHEIHCLDWIKREWKAERPEMMDHLDHCLIGLRDGATCRADLTVGSLYWGNENGKNQNTRPDATRSCVKWDSLENWLTPRRLKIHNGVGEEPVTPDGRLVDVVLNDNLHTITTLGEED